MSNLLPLSKQPNSICILRLSALGDVTHTLPVVRAIQSSWPDTEITWVCGKLEYKLLSSIKNINFIVFDKSQGWQAYANLRKQLKNKEFDVLLQLQVALRANIASLFIKSKIKLGWDKNRSRDFHQLFINHHVDAVEQQHQVQGFLSFARALGLKAVEPVWEFPISVEASQFVENNITGNAPILLISPCSSHYLRNWSEEKYAKVADYAVNKLNMQVVLSGGPSELEIKSGEKIESLMAVKPINLIGKDTLQQSIALLKKVDVVISPDSGPAHIANAVGTNVIGLYSCTWSKRSGPYNSLQNCVDKFSIAAEKFLNKSTDNLRWGTKIEMPGVMDLIEVSEVCEQLEKLMSSQAQQS